MKILIFVITGLFYQTTLFASEQLRALKCTYYNGTVYEAPRFLLEDDLVKDKKRSLSFRNVTINFEVINYNKVAVTDTIDTDHTGFIELPFDYSQFFSSERNLHMKSLFPDRYLSCKDVQLTVQSN